MAQGDRKTGTFKLDNGTEVSCSAIQDAKGRWIVDGGPHNGEVVTLVSAKDDPKDK